MADDQITVDLVARMDSYNASLNAAASQTEAFGNRVKTATDGISSSINSATDAIKDLAGALGIGLSVDKLVEVANASLEAAERVSNLSQSLGVSTQTLQTMSYAAGLVGGNLDTVSNSLAHAERSAEQAAAGNAQAAEAFRALGIDATQLASLLKNPDQFMQTLAQHVSAAGDGLGKTGAVMQIFGRNASEVIPFLNEMGENFDELTKQSEALGVTLSGAMQASLLQANEGLDKSALAAKGLGNEFTAALVPAINAANAAFQNFVGSGNAASFFTQLGQFIRDAIDWFQSFATAVQHVTVNVAAYWDEMMIKMKASLSSGTSGWASAISGALSVLSGGALGGYIAAVSKAGDANKDLQSQLNAVRGAAADSNAAIDRNQASYKAATAAADALGVVVGNYYEQLANGDKSEAAHAAALDAAAKASDQLIAKGADYNTVVNAEVETVGKIDTAFQKANAAQVNYNAAVNSGSNELQNAEAAAQKFLDSLDAIGADKYTQALAKYNTELDTANQIFDKMIASGASFADAENFVEAATEKAKAGLDAQVQSMRNLNDVDAILSLSMAKQTSDWDTQLKLLTENKEAADADALANQLVTKALGDMKDFMGPLSQAQQDLIDRLTAMAHGFVAQKTAIEQANEATKEWVNLWEQAGSNLADTFAKILVEGGSLFSSLVDLAKQTVEQIIAYFAKLAIINPILNAIFGGTAGFSALPELGGGLLSGAAGGAGGAGGLANLGTSILGGGQNLFGAIFGTGGQQSILGSLTGTGDFDFGGSLLGSLGAGALGAFGGYQLGSALGGTAGGIAGAAGIGALSYFVPVVGWIMGAATLINSLTGGGLFGSPGKFNFGQVAANIGPTGANVTEGYDLKGKQALFGGSTHEWKTVTPDQASVDAWNQFFQTLVTGDNAFAKTLGATAGAIAAGSFVQNFDKKGNVTGSTTTIAGHTYSGETAQQFQEREIAETMINTLSQFDSKLSDSIDQYRANADTLYALTQQLAGAQQYLNNGGHFLALGTDQSLSALLKLAAGAQQFGETIDQTVARIEQAQQQYDQFVGQFKPQTSYVDDFEATLAGINDQMNQNIATANALAQAAGAQGASEQDLANIHQYAANQAAAAISALEASAQSLAFSLGLTSVGSLDQVNQEIAQLQAKANSGAGAVSDFGNAMSQAAQKAKDAISLLIGDLSPLNDVQKLQAALQGLRAGTVTADQVLEIGRRLYASSQQYTDLFNMVQGIAPAGGSQVTSSGVGHSGLSAADSARLQQLLKEQSQLQAAATLQQYQTLAQQIAEIASAKGEDWQKVVSDMGIDEKAFEKGLGMNEEQLGAYITSIQQQTDSAGDNTKSIIDAINDMSDAVVRALGGTPASHADANTGAPGHSTGRAASGRNFSDADANAIGQAVGRAVNLAINPPGRNYRQRQQMTVGGG